MTAPDPGLTDLIAAHWYNTSTCMCTCGWSTRHLPESDDDTRIGILVARHLALVVEQHTNGRIAELEAELDALYNIVHRVSLAIEGARERRAASEGEQQ